MKIWQAVCPCKLQSSLLASKVSEILWIPFLFDMKVPNWRQRRNMYWNCIPKPLLTFGSNTRTNDVLTAEVQELSKSLRTACSCCWTPAACQSWSQKQIFAVRRSSSMEGHWWRWRRTKGRTSELGRQAKSIISWCWDSQQQETTWHALQGTNVFDHWKEHHFQQLLLPFEGILLWLFACNSSTFTLGEC